jgi:hypothetical protein
MMLAAADYGLDSKSPPPPDLELAFACKRWNSLPEAGGLLDQPAGLIQRMTVAENIYNAFRAMVTAKNAAKFADDNPGVMDLIENVTRLREEYGMAHNTNNNTGGDNG